MSMSIELESVQVGKDDCWEVQSLVQLMLTVIGNATWVREAAKGLQWRLMKEMTLLLASYWIQQCRWARMILLLTMAIRHIFARHHASVRRQVKLNACILTEEKWQEFEARHLEAEEDYWSDCEYSNAEQTPNECTPGKTSLSMIAKCQQCRMHRLVCHWPSAIVTRQKQDRQRREEAVEKYAPV